MSLLDQEHFLTYSSIYEYIITYILALLNASYEQRRQIKAK